MRWWKKPQERSCYQFQSDKGRQQLQLNPQRNSKQWRWWWRQSWQWRPSSQEHLTLNFILHALSAPFGKNQPTLFWRSNFILKQSFCGCYSPCMIPEGKFLSDLKDVSLGSYRTEVRQRVAGLQSHPKGQDLLWKGCALRTGRSCCFLKFYSIISIRFLNTMYCSSCQFNMKK